MSDGKESCSAGDLSSILGWEDPLEKGMAPTAVFMPGEFHGQRSLAGYSPGCRRESGITERSYHTGLFKNMPQWHIDCFGLKLLEKLLVKKKFFFKLTLTLVYPPENGK